MILEKAQTADVVICSRETCQEQACSEWSSNHPLKGGSTRRCCSACVVIINVEKAY